MGEPQGKIEKPDQVEASEMAGLIDWNSLDKEVAYSLSDYQGDMSIEWRSAPNEALLLAILLYDALRGQQPNAHVQGCPALDDTVVDGSFNLVTVASFILQRQKLLLHPS